MNRVSADARHDPLNVSIVRSPRPQVEFFLVANRVARDSRLSYKARGLLMDLLSRPDNWRVSAVTLAKEAIDGRDAVRSGLRELRDAGYLVTVRRHDAKGRLVTESHVFDTPQDVDNVVDLVPPETENPFLDKPDIVGQIGVKPETENPSLDKPDIMVESGASPDTGFPSPVTLSLEILKDKRYKTSDDSTFNQFWEIYPRHDGRKPALQAFTRALKETPLETILAGARRYAALGKEPKFTLMAATWLNQERWNDELPVTKPTQMPPRMSENDRKVGIPMPAGFRDLLPDTLRFAQKRGDGERKSLP